MTNEDEKHHVLGRDQSYIVKKTNYSVSDTAKMLFKFLLIDDAYGMVCGRIFQQTVGIHMGTNCAPRFTDLFHVSLDFMQWPPKNHEKKLVRSLNFTFRYAYDVRSRNSSKLDDHVDRIYPIELEIMDTTLN